MEIHFSVVQEAELANVAMSKGIDTESLVRAAALELLRSQRPVPAQPGIVAEEMRALRSRVPPDPDGWTTRDYVLHGRR